jgi:hypothetical protein
MGSTLLGLIWLVSPVLCVVVASKTPGLHWGPAVALGVLLGPIGLAVVFIIARKVTAAAERERSRMPALDSSRPTLDARQAQTGEGPEIPGPTVV